MDPFPVPVALNNQPSLPHSPPQQQPSVVFLPLHPSAAASSTAPAASPTLNHPPPYDEMIYAAITVLKEKGGSSKIAIGKHIEQTYSNLPANHSTLLTQHLQHLKNTGHLLMVKKSYKLPRCDDPVPETNNNQDNAVNISSSAHGPKTTRGRSRPPKNLNALNAQPVSKSMTRRPVGRPRKVLAHVQAQPISDAIGEANAAVPKKSKSRTKRPRPVGRPRKVLAQAQPISDAIGETDAAVPKKSKSRTRRPRPVGRPMKSMLRFRPRPKPNRFWMLLVRQMRLCSKSPRAGLEGLGLWGGPGRFRPRPRPNRFQMLLARQMRLCPKSPRAGLDGLGLWGGPGRFRPMPKPNRFRMLLAR